VLTGLRLCYKPTLSRSATRLLKPYVNWYARPITAATAGARPMTTRDSVALEFRWNR
jgi:hypothetical protein